MSLNFIIGIVVGFLFGLTFYFLGKAHAFRESKNEVRKYIKKLEERRVVLTGKD